MVNRKPEDKVCPFLSINGEGMTYCIGDRCAMFGEEGCSLVEVVKAIKAPSLKEINQRMMNIGMGLSPEDRVLLREVKPITEEPKREEEPLSPEELKSFEAEGLDIEGLEDKDPIYEEEGPVITLQPSEEEEDELGGEEVDFPPQVIKDPVRIKELPGKGKKGGKGGAKGGRHG